MKNITNVLEYLEHSAKRFPDKPAYVDAKNSYTFSQLEQAARSVGSALCRSVEKGSPVAVYMEKSAQQIVAFLGVVYAGAFYVPIDADMPAQRVRLILDTLETRVVITDTRNASKLEDNDFGGTIFLFSELDKTTVDMDWLTKIRRSAIDSDPLYAIFTSGSTSVPKGVLTSQRSAINFTEWYSSVFEFSDAEIFGNQTPFYFDASVKDIYATLRCGATMYIIPKTLFSSPVQLIEYLNDKKINCIDWVPSALCLIVNFDVFSKVMPLYLKKVMFLGEVMPTKQFNMWRKALPEVQYANLYGPTEATGDCTYYKVMRELRDDEPIPIGYACENTDVLILNENNELVKEDEIGEICVRGVSIALGYYNNSEKTKSVFVQNPLQKHYKEMIYRTGDLAKYNERGELMYVGRKDFQIKISGYRIELGEIETAISAVSGVSSICCLFDEAIKQIFCIYTGEVEKNDLRKQIRTALPRYMMPHKYIRLETMPLNANGKIDRVKLRQMFIQNKGESRI